MGTIELEEDEFNILHKDLLKVFKTILIFHKLKIKKKLTSYLTTFDQLTIIYIVSQLDLLFDINENETWDGKLKISAEYVKFKNVDLIILSIKN
ncbi:hypothetical protein BpHYR1_033964 [Brachionus plicatilis]|uniref:Uncharacterized protein n=1 Tax=Brachionus plicatilis TaxID=10195 RepID=A0A3M7QLG1_BRAPC|nr:hypothetical protein BpHYR1_033964 [Brachionus plicatilis]